ncbi:conserved hypothetical protein [Planktothrix serta PCC 8927]|uniref:Transcriptional regulator HTH-type FeoC domain-containing protein n=1 Tax=Planktothrix serta PCC 8927 TaxID=671068 RepID=A0A7Z9BS19_9CYAN|nr:FeoC-like transcriptional regulator [Planktothrix serta]VXD21691.1 conserved hypothetical protein [Planktothrix serta PCC 8927]
MILQEIQQYLCKHPVSSLTELSQHFHSDPDALRLMLERLQSKGRVRKLEAKKCGGCQSCAPETLELYEWINS